MPYLRFADAFDWSVTVHTAIQDAYVRSGNLAIDPAEVAKALGDPELIAEIETAATYANVPVRVGSSAHLHAPATQEHVRQGPV